MKRQMRQVIFPLVPVVVLLVIAMVFVVLDASAVPPTYPSPPTPTPPTPPPLGAATTTPLPTATPVAPVTPMPPGVEFVVVPDDNKPAGYPEACGDLNDRPCDVVCFYVPPAGSAYPGPGATAVAPQTLSCMPWHLIKSTSP